MLILELIFHCFKDSHLKSQVFSNISLSIVTMSVNTPAEYGKRLIPQILDNLATTEPDRIIFSIAKFRDTSHEFRHISARTFAKAVDKTAWWLHGQLGGKPKNKNGSQAEEQMGDQKGIQNGKSTSIQVVGYIGPRKRKKKTVKGTL